MKTLLHVQEPFALPLHHLGDRNAGPARHHFRHLVFGDGGTQQLRLPALGVSGEFELLFELGQPAVLNLRHATEIAGASRRLELQPCPFQGFLDVLGALHCRLFGLPDLFQIRVVLFAARDLLLESAQAFTGCGVGLLAQRFALYLELDEAPVEAVHRFRLGIDLHANAARRFVNEVDCLVRKLSVGNVAMRQGDGGHDGGIRDVDSVMDFVALLEASQNRNTVLHTRLLDQHSLEAALERGVFFHALAVLVEGRGADAVELASGECGLEHVSGVHRPFRLAGADQGV